MPELPEVETICRGLQQPLQQKTLTQVAVRQDQLRYKVPTVALKRLNGQVVRSVGRRAKYLLLELEDDNLLIHLGMSGTLRLLTPTTKIRKHDHADFIFNDELCMRFNDPRRFGMILVFKKNDQPVFLDSLGIEPLSRACTGGFLYEQIQRRKSPIKSVLMNNKIIVGVGNIYAAESLFYAKISPLRPAKNLSLDDCNLLVKELKKVLRKAIQAGGTTLKDFYSLEGQPGYFTQKLAVYGREGQSCWCCQTRLIKSVIAGRSTVFCCQCQPF